MRRERRELRSASEPGSDATTPADAERLHAREQVESVLRHVSADGRRVFVLHHLFGFSFKEIAAKLGITPGAAKIRSSRAASLMRALLGENRDE
jgi:RNA polymerase sigma factor (sigma-70 family)